MSTKLERIIRLDALIRSGRYPNVETIAAYYEVSERTIYDDATFLRERLHAPIAYDTERGGWYYTEVSWVLPAFITTEGELLTFLLTTDLAGRYLGSGYEDTLRRAVDSLAQTLPKRIELDLDELASQYSFTAGATAPVAPRLLADLTGALRDRHPIEVTYYTASRNARSERILHPYAILNVQGNWQLAAYDNLRDAVRIFALTRIEHWAVQRGVTFERQHDFSLDDYMQTAFINERGGDPQQIVIQFDEYQARYIRERQWHRSQHPLEELPDGGVILRFSSGALEEIQRWVASFGQHAEVLAPPALRQAIAKDISALAHKYS